MGLDQPINAYIDGTPESWKDITVRHLLTHTAGFPPNGQNFKSSRAPASGSHRMTLIIERYK